MSQASAAKEEVINVHNLKTVIGDQVIHQGLSLKVYRGEIYGVLGGSGSGKTTLLRAILRLQPASGSIKIFGKEILSAQETEFAELQSHWGMVFQRGALFSSLTALENIAFPLQEHKKLKAQEIKKIAQEKLKIVGLKKEAGNKYPAELSGGMIKRVAVARALAIDPELLFLDEPTAGLDPRGASGLDDLIMDLRKSLGFTTVIVTHDLDTLWRMTDRVAFLGEGKVLQEGTMDDLYHSNIPPIKEYFSDPRSRIIHDGMRQQEHN